MNSKMTFLPAILRIGVILTVFLGLVALNSCNDLDFPDPNNPLVEDASVQSHVTGIEAGMRRQLNVFLLANAVIGREAYNFDPADPAWTDEVLYGPLDPGGFVALNPWEERYRVILNCNFLKDKAAGDQSILGFANTIMGYQLLLMSNYMYDNGIKLLSVLGTLDNFTSNHQQSLEAVADLLDEAASQLDAAAADGNTFPFNLTGGFAGFDTPSTFKQFNRGLRARVALYLQDWQGALTAVNASFLDPGGDLNKGVYHLYGTGLGELQNPIFESPTASFVKFRAHPSFKTDAEAGDLRFANKVLDRTGDPTFNPNFGESDLASPLVITVSSGATGPFPIIRNEELILIRAEARLQTQDYGGAEADMNIVRAAAGLPGYTGTDASNALDRLLHERRYSLFAEGHRWVDMRRYGRLDQLPLDRKAEDKRPSDDVVHVQFPRPQPEVSGG